MHAGFMILLVKVGLSEVHLHGVIVGTCHHKWYLLFVAKWSFSDNMAEKHDGGMHPSGFYQADNKT